MVSTTENKNEGTEIQYLAMIPPTSDAITEIKAKPKILTTSQPLGSMFTCSAEFSILMVPELKHKHENEPTEINEMLQIKH